MALPEVLAARSQRRKQHLSGKENGWEQGDPGLARLAASAWGWENSRGEIPRAGREKSASGQKFVTLV